MKSILQAPQSLIYQSAEAYTRGLPTRTQDSDCMRDFRTKNVFCCKDENKQTYPKRFCFCTPP